MALRYLISWDDPLFRKKSRPVGKFDERLWALLDDMHDTLEKVGGYDFAAVHVDILRRVAIINDERGVIELVNPVITEESAEKQEVPEGSIPPGAPRRAIVRPEKCHGVGS